jgi:hypothetical protein
MADRVMEDCRATYNPVCRIAEIVEGVTQPHDLNQAQQIDPTEATGAGCIGVAYAPEELQQQVTRKERFKELADAEEHERLLAAPMHQFGNSSTSLPHSQLFQQIPLEDSVVCPLLSGAWSS